MIVEQAKTVRAGIEQGIILVEARLVSIGIELENKPAAAQIVVVVKAEGSLITEWLISSDPIIRLRYRPSGHVYHTDKRERVDTAGHKRDQAGIVHRDQRVPERNKLSSGSGDIILKHSGNAAAAAFVNADNGMPGCVDLRCRKAHFARVVDHRILKVPEALAGMGNAGLRSD